MFVLQPYIFLNYGKDFTQDTIEVVARGPPGGYVAINAVDYEFMLRGALPFITEQKVRAQVFKMEQLRYILFSILAAYSFTSSA